MAISNFGDLKTRIIKHTLRLKEYSYCSPLIFSQNEDWPGDWEGRTILALCCQYSVINDPVLKKGIKDQLEDIFDNLAQYINSQGYFGQKANWENINEQQLSGNSWFLRGLCKYWELFKDQKAMDLIRSITDHLLCSLKGKYKNYPADSRRIGGAAGQIVDQKRNGWALSSDVGCAFILLDGITDVCRLTKDARLIPVIDEMIEKFMTVDFEANNYQTHATLSALRGMIRYYLINKDIKLLDFVRRAYDIYWEKGTTLNYSNINWFGRPKTWTETCANVDAILLAKSLFEITGKVRYLTLLNRVYYNSIRSSQRTNGGAGCEECVCSPDDILRIHLYEANFCCTMRLAEGLEHLTYSQYIVRGNEVICALFGTYNKAELFDGELILSVKSALEERGVIEINVERCSLSGVSLKLYVPSHFKTEANYVASGGFIEIRDLSEGKIAIPYSLQSFTEEKMGFELNMLGDIILTQKLGGDNNEYAFSLNKKDAILTPITDCQSLPDKDAELNLAQKICF